MSRMRLVLMRACELSTDATWDHRVVGWSLASTFYDSQAVKLASDEPSHLVLDESTNWFPSASLKIAAVPQCSVLGGIGNSTPFAESSS
jgi:hypothetical protein